MLMLSGVTDFYILLVGMNTDTITLEINLAFSIKTDNSHLDLHIASLVVVLGKFFQVYT